MVRRIFFLSLLAFLTFGPVSSQAQSPEDIAQEILQRETHWLLIYAGALNYHLPDLVLPTEEVERRYRSLRSTYHGLLGFSQAGSLAFSFSLKDRIEMLELIIRTTAYLDYDILFLVQRGGDLVKSLGISVVSLSGSQALPSSESSSVLGSPSKALKMEWFRQWSHKDEADRKQIQALAENTLYILDLPQQHLPLLTESIEKEWIEQSASLEKSEIFVDIPRIIGTLEDENGRPLLDDARYRILTRLDQLLKEGADREFERQNEIDPQKTEKLFSSLSLLVSMLEVYLETDSRIPEEIREKTRKTIVQAKGTLTRVDFLLSAGVSTEKK